MTLVRGQPRTEASPWRHFFRNHNHLNHMFDQFWNDDEDATMIRWRPAVDVAETENEYTVTATARNDQG